MTEGRRRGNWGGCDDYARPAVNGVGDAEVEGIVDASDVTEGLWCGEDVKLAMCESMVRDEDEACGRTEVRHEGVLVEGLCAEEGSRAGGGCGRLLVKAMAGVDMVKGVVVVGGESAVRTARCPADGVEVVAVVQIEGVMVGDRIGKGTGDTGKDMAAGADGYPEGARSEGPVVGSVVVSDGEGVGRHAKEGNVGEGDEAACRVI